MTRARLPLSALAAIAVALVGLGTASPSTTTALPQPTVTWTDPDPVGAGTATTSSTQLFKYSTVVGGKAVRWNPCEPIKWKFRTAGAPTGSGTVVKAAVARIALATGIRFVYDGTTTATPTSRWLPQSSTSIRPLLIGWTDGAHSDLLAGRPASVLGVTRTAYFATSRDGVALAATKGAVIALDRTNRLPLTGAVSWKTTLLHELGHAMGLDHVGNSRQLMYPVLQRTLYGLQSGDLAGLYRLGRAAGCIDLGF
jgi:hypothetical protein